MQSWFKTQRYQETKNDRSAPPTDRAHFETTKDRFESAKVRFLCRFEAKNVLEALDCAGRFKSPGGSSPNCRRRAHSRRPSTSPRTTSTRFSTAQEGRGQGFGHCSSRRLLGVATPANRPAASRAAHGRTSSASSAPFVVTYAFWIGEELREEVCPVVGQASSRHLVATPSQRRRRSPAAATQWGYDVRGL